MQGTKVSPNHRVTMCYLRMMMRRSTPAGLLITAIRFSMNSLIVYIARFYYLG